jgi:hypothetical protein
MGALDDLVAGFGTGASTKQTRECTAVGCSQRVFGYALFCPECWRQISSDLQRLIEKHHRPGRRPSKVLLQWMQSAIDELMYIRLNGRRPPAPQTFMWDNAPAAPAPLETPLLDEKE